MPTKEVSKKSESWFKHDIIYKEAYIFDTIFNPI